MNESVMPDLRRVGCADAAARAEAELGVRLDTSRAVVKRRTWGAPSDADTWVRLQLWPAGDPVVERVPGVVAASALTDIPRPGWYRGVRWEAEGLVWRADELDLVTEPVVIPAGTLRTDPGLSDQWWRDLVRALHGVATTAVPLPQQKVCQQGFTDRITAVFGSNVDATVTAWAGSTATWVSPTSRLRNWPCWIGRTSAPGQRAWITPACGRPSPARSPRGCSGCDSGA